MNTKVEFPEARIYEETLNCLLYEDRIGPNQGHMQVPNVHLKYLIFCETQATSTSGAGASSTSDDENEPNRPGGDGDAGEERDLQGSAGEGGAGGGAAVVPPGARSHSSGLARLRSNKKIHITFT